jgi:hypothetical protein
VVRVINGGVFNDIEKLEADLCRGSLKEELARVRDLADAVVIDEAHHFRNKGQPAPKVRHSTAQGATLGPDPAQPS